MVSNKSNKEATLLDTGILAVFGGVAVASLYPPFTAIGGLMAAAGGAGILYYFTTWSSFDKVFKNLHICKGSAYPIIKEIKETDISTIYRFTVPAGISIDDFDRNKKAIEMYLGREIDIKPIYKAVQIEVYDQEAQTRYDYEIIPCRGKVEIPIGYDRRGDIITCDLSTGQPHMLIAGETGSGKSTALRAIITNLLLTKDIKLHLIDLKCGAEFQIFGRCKNVISFGRTRSEAARILQAISQEVDRRYNLFYKHDCVDIKEYNKLIGGMGYEMLIVDEFADLHDDKQSIALLEEIAAKARACGIHLILCTQRPDHKILNGRIKANVSNVLGLKTMNDINSRIILDTDGLEALRGAGHGIFKRNEQTMIQCPYLSTERARELLRPLYVQRDEEQPPANGDINNFAFLEAIC